MTATTTPARSIARVKTDKASGYLQQLCKHFAHKIPASFDAAQGQLTFPYGDCRLTAQPDMLVIEVETPDPAQILQLADVIERHLVRFAFREELVLDWQAA